MFFFFFCRLQIFFKINFFEIFVQEYHLSVKQIGFRSGPMFCQWYESSSSPYFVYASSEASGKSTCASVRADLNLHCLPMHSEPKIHVLPIMASSLKHFQLEF